MYRISGTLCAATFTMSASASVEEAFFSQPFIKFTNIERYKVGSVPLTMVDQLQDAADIRAKEIMTDYRYDHLRPDGSKFNTAIDPSFVKNRTCGQKVPRNKTVPDQWESQILARVLTKAAVIVVSPELDPELPVSMHMRHARTPDEALLTARQLCNTADPRISVIPDGVSVIVSKME